MTSIKVEGEKDGFKFLKETGCCLRCCFRFFGNRTLDYYLNPIEHAKKLNFIETEEELNLENPCVICLGILQDATLETAIGRIIVEVEKKNYDCETFITALTIPISIPLRERSIQVYMEKENPSIDTKFKIQSIKDVWKWIAIPKIESLIKKHIDVTTPSPFLIEILLTHTSDEHESCILLSQYNGSTNQSSQKKRSNEKKYSRKNIESLMSDTTDEEFAQFFSIPPTKCKTGVTVGEVSCSHTSIFIGGRYNKLSRELSQTPWFINGEKKMETSVQDILCNPIVQSLKADSMKFLSSGREDVDVRNIYSGRPFAVELINPKITSITNDMLSHLMSTINKSSTQVQITSNLKILTRLDLQKLKEGENVKTKFYRALCICRDASQDEIDLEILNGMKNLKIIQKTPIRVLHRRPLAPRTRYVYEIRARWAKEEELEDSLCKPMNEKQCFFVLDIKTQAGTYVKEFVHGDFGRTKPSLCDLFNKEVDIVALDVTGINIDWP